MTKTSTHSILDRDPIIGDIAIIDNDQTALYDVLALDTAVRDQMIYLRRHCTTEAAQWVFLNRVCVIDDEDPRAWEG